VLAVAVVSVVDSSAAVLLAVPLVVAVAVMAVVAVVAVVG